MSRAQELRDLAEVLGPPLDEALWAHARWVEEQTGALEAAESALDHARRTADPESARVIAAAQSRAQRALLDDAA